MELTKREKVFLGIGLVGLGVGGYFACKYLGSKTAFEMLETKGKQLISDNNKLKESVDILMKAASENVFQEAIGTVNNKLGYRIDKKKYLEAALKVNPNDVDVKKALERVTIEIKELMGRRDSYEAALELYEIKDELL
jgi:hypothetical protein